MAEDLIDERAVFDAVRCIESSELRQACMEAMCGSDAALRARVSSLLSAYAESENFLESPPVELCTGTYPADLAPIGCQNVVEGPGTFIGPYKLLQQIGEGGMGVVFMAEQSDPIQRTVALKIIKPGMDTRRVIARFEAERQAVAMMDHPNIAKVLDAGTTDSGRPYFVMELVKGVPITKYCDDEQLSLRERLELLLPICQAVQHAHQKGVIHRDIKPTNVLVAEYDNEPIPKVIDFGVAKATASKLTQRTMFTEFGQVLGTVEYMSPEQAKLNQLDVDTRSDIYSLGVLMYELLTGSTPFEGKRLKEAAFDEMLRIIRDEEPPKPSTRLSTSAALHSIAATGGSERKELRRLVKGELDWVVMKALDKDRNRRYETASAFAADVQRYLDDELVQARPASAGYRFRKFARRHKLGVAAGLAVTAALVLGVAGTTGGMLWALQERKVAQAAAIDAKSQAARSERVSGFLSAIAMLSNVRASVAFGRDTMLLREILNDSDRWFRQGDFKDQPAVEANLWHAISKVHSELGDYATAESMLRKALNPARTAYGESDLHLVFIADSFHQLGFSYMDNGEVHPAEAAHREALSIYEKTLNDGDPRLLGARRILTSILRSEGKFAEAEQLYRIGLESARRRNDAVWIGDNLLDLGAVLVAQGEYADAEPLLREALAVRDKTQPTKWWGHYDAISTLGGAVAGLSRFTEAEPLLLEGWDGMQRDPESWDVRRREALERLVKLYEAWDEAEPGHGYAGKVELWRQRLAAFDTPPAASATPEAPSTDQAARVTSNPSSELDTDANENGKSELKE